MWFRMLASVKDHVDCLASSRDPGCVAASDYCALHHELNLYLSSEKSLKSNNGIYMAIQVATTFPYAEISTFVAKLQDRGSDHAPSSLSISCAGLNMIRLDMAGPTKNDTHIMDVIAFPASLLVVCVVCVVLRMNVPLVTTRIVLMCTTMST